MTDANPRASGEVLVRAQQEALTAAENGDELAFAAVVQRLGSLEEAQRLVRAKAFMRMSDRGAIPRIVLPAAPEWRDDSGDPATSAPQLVGHFAVFNEWTEIDSMFEGNFLERIAPGAFKKTMDENAQSMRVLFQHGSDPFLGDKVLGKIESLSEDRVGARYSVSLFNGLPDLLMEGLRAGAYGASFRFRAVIEQFNEYPDPSEVNPRGLPERTLKEVQVPEFGPVTFPAYRSATAGIRSITDSAMEDRAEESSDDARSDTDATITDDLVVAGSAVERRSRTRDYLNSNEETPTWLL